MKTVLDVIIVYAAIIAVAAWIVYGVMIWNFAATVMIVMSVIIVRIVLSVKNVLIVISVALTLLSGLIPAGSASRKNPVEALRSE